MWLMSCRSWEVWRWSVTSPAPPPLAQSLATPTPSPVTCCVLEVSRARMDVRETVGVLWWWRMLKLSKILLWEWSVGALGVPEMDYQEYMLKFQVRIVTFHFSTAAITMCKFPIEYITWMESTFEANGGTGNVCSA